MIYNEYKDREGDLIMGIVQRYEKGNYIIDLGKAEALLPYREQSFREQLHRGDRLRAYVLELFAEGLSLRHLSRPSRLRSYRPRADSSARWKT